MKARGQNRLHGSLNRLKIIIIIKKKSAIRAEFKAKALKAMGSGIFYEFKMRFMMQVVFYWKTALFAMSKQKISFNLKTPGINFNRVDGLFCKQNGKLMFKNFPKREIVYKPCGFCLINYSPRKFVKNYFLPGSHFSMRDERATLIFDLLTKRYLL